MKYIGTKMVEAVPAQYISDDRQGYVLAKDEKPKAWMHELLKNPEKKIREGYKVTYEDGYTSFSPKDVFEKAYLPLSVNQKLRTDAPSISQEMVDGFIDSWETTTMGGKNTVVRAVLVNGFEIVESSACVSAENYDERLGEQICLKKIKDKVWFLLGFLLQTAVHGVGGSGGNPFDIWQKTDMGHFEPVGAEDPDEYIKREL